jgi:hypothetical protein
MKNMSWPTTIVIALVVLVVGYFVGQALHLDHTTPAAAAPTVTVTTVTTVAPAQELRA